MKAKVLKCTIGLAIIGGIVVTTIVMSKKTRRKAIDLVETVMDEAEAMI